MSDYLELEAKLIELVAKKTELERFEAQVLVARKQLADHAREIIMVYDSKICWTNVVQVGSDTYVIKFDLESGLLDSIQDVPNFTAWARREYRE